MSQWFLSYSLYCCRFISAYSFHNYLSLYGSWQKKISLQSASKCFQSFGPPGNGNKSNTKKSRFCPNRNLTGTIYHWSVILRSFSVVLNPVKRDANGFFKVLLLSSHLLISLHPVQKSNLGACAVTGYCSFNYFSQLSVWQAGKKEFVGDLLAKNIPLQIMPTKLYTDEWQKWTEAICSRHYKIINNNKRSLRGG